MKKVMAFLLVVSLAFCLSACADTKAPKPNGGSNDSSEEMSDVKLTYWSMWNETEPQAIVISNAVKELKTKTGITVEAIFNGRDTKKTLEPAIDSGTEIDIFDYDLEWLHENWGSHTLVLEDYINKGYKMTDGEPLEDNLNKLMLSLARSVGPDKKLDCIPYQPCSNMIMYNKTLFKKAGINTAPVDWKEFLADCKKLKDNGIVPLTVDDAYMALPFGAYLARLIGQDGIDQLVTSKKWDTPEVRTTAKAWKEFYDLEYVSNKAATNVFPAGEQEIAGGDAAMYLNGTFLPNEVKNSVSKNLQWGSFAFPAVENGKNGIETNYYGCQCFAVSNKSKHPKEAMEFIAMMTTGTWDETLAKESIGIPMSKKSLWPSELQEAKGVFDKTTSRLKNNYGLHVDKDQYPVIKESMSRLLSGKYSVDQFVKAIAH